MSSSPKTLVERNWQTMVDALTEALATRRLRSIVKVESVRPEAAAVAAGGLAAGMVVNGFSLRARRVLPLVVLTKSLPLSADVLRNADTGDRAALEASIKLLAEEAASIEDRLLWQGQHGQPGLKHAGLKSDVGDPSLAKLTERLGAAIDLLPKTSSSFVVVVGAELGAELANPVNKAHADAIKKIIGDPVTCRLATPPVVLAEPAAASALHIAREWSLDLVNPADDAAEVAVTSTLVARSVRVVEGVVLDSEP